jgi:hypothetical protein
LKKRAKFRNEQNSFEILIGSLELDCMTRRLKILKAIIMNVIIFSNWPA